MCQEELVHFEQPSGLDWEKLEFPQKGIGFIPQAHKKVRQVTVEVVVNISPL